MNTLKLGVIGMSEGNGHPYSWSAIFNGYDPAYMKSCPFPVIPEYLSKQRFPEDSLGHLATVTQVWCPDKDEAEHIAAAAKISKVANSLEEMAANVDAVLLARDDAETHYQYALPFLKAGNPIFIDKPLAIKESEADKIWNAQQFEQQVFSTSSLRYAKGLLLTEKEKEKIGTIKVVEGSVMKKWETYAIHILEPAVAQLPQRGKLRNIRSSHGNGIRQAIVQWENVNGYFKTTGKIPVPLELKFFGDRGCITKTFTDSFNAFKNSLEAFIKVIENPGSNIAQDETRELVKILEVGLR